MSLMLALAAAATAGLPLSTAVLLPMSGQSLMGGQENEAASLPADRQTPFADILTASYGTWPRPGQPTSYTAPVLSETFSLKPLWADHTSWSIYDWPITGPEQTIARDVQAFYDRQIFLMKYAYGGLPISYWLPGGEMYKTIRRLIPDYEGYLLGEGGYTDIRYPFFTWFQGEADAILGRTTEQYAADLTAVVLDFRAQSQYTAGTPFIFRELSVAQTAITEVVPDGIANINAAFEIVCDTLPNCHRFNNDFLNLPTLSDKTHYSLPNLQQVAALVTPLAQSLGYL